MSEEKKFQGIRIDITSGVAEKTIDAALSFLNEIFGGAANEVGNIIFDQVRAYRFKRQIETLKKTGEYCEKHNITPKAISLKLLFPLIENASLEDEPHLQGKWSVLLGNLVDSEQNIQNHVFPALLGQISASEYIQLEDFVLSFIRTIESAKIIYKQYKWENTDKIEVLEKSIKELEEWLNEVSNLDDKSDAPEDYVERRALYDKQSTDLIKLRAKVTELTNACNKQPILVNHNLREFEIANLVRLGLIKENKKISLVETTQPILPEDIYSPYYFTPHMVSYGSDFYLPQNHLNKKQKLKSRTELIVTELGVMFINATNEKRT